MYRLVMRIKLFFLLSLLSATSAFAAWQTSVVDTAGGGYTSLALDTSGNPHISYFENSNQDLKYAKWNGSSWTTQIIDAAGYAGFYTSIALDSSDKPRIAYHSGAGSYTLKYAEWNGSAWALQTVASAYSGYDTSLVLDSNDNPHITYHEDTNTGFLKYIKWTGAAWAGRAPC